MNFSDYSRRHPENHTIPGLLLVRPENGLFFANAAGIHEAIIREVNASAVPVKAVSPRYGRHQRSGCVQRDMLIELHKQLRQRDVRFSLTTIIMPVRQILERADKWMR